MLTDDPSTLTDFHATVEAFLGEYFSRNPGYAAHLGFHEYDGGVTDYSAAAIEGWLGRVRHYRGQLATFDRAALPAGDQFDLDVLDLALDSELFRWAELADWRRNPMEYLSALDVSSYLKRNYAPLAIRVQAAARQLDHVPDTLAQARANLVLPLPASFVETSLSMYKGTLGFMEHELPAAVEQLRDDAGGADHGALLADFESRRHMAADALREFMGYLESLQAGATQDFAIGADRYRRMLWTGEAVDLPLDALLAVGEADLARNGAAFEALAKSIDPARTPVQLIEELGTKHPGKDDLVPETRAMLEELRDWVIAHDLVGVPSDVRIEVAETPSFMRWAFAMMDAPGAFERVAKESFYYVTPPEENWSAGEQEEWLTKFDYATLRDVSIHEAYPGHYVHFLHYQNVPSRVRRIFGAYSFWEAWAHYSEHVMVEQAFRPADHDLRLAQLSEALLRDVRFVVSIKMHTLGMSVDDATRFFMERAYLPEKPARQEAVRGTFDPGYLNYTLGKLMLLKLREDCRARAAAASEAFSLRQFHDQFLSYGAPPVPFVRRAMLGGADGSIL